MLTKRLLQAGAVSGLAEAGALTSSRCMSSCVSCSSQPVYEIVRRGLRHAAAYGQTGSRQLEDHGTPTASLSRVHGS